MRGIVLLILILALSGNRALADGAFVFEWDKQRDINEPTQKAIILHDQGREDLVLQVKYEGPEEEFGWLVPVPGLPEVREGSMQCFYELSRLTQVQFGEGTWTHSGRGVGNQSVQVIEVKTVGAYEVAVLSADSARKLNEWLDSYGFVFPKDKQSVLDGYIKKHWYFVAVKIDPSQTGFVLRNGVVKRSALPALTQQKLTSGELNPLVISFPSERAVFPLSISAVNGKPSEVSLYILSAEPLANRTIFEKNLAAFSKERDAWIKQENEKRSEQDRLAKEEELKFDKHMADHRSEAAADPEFAAREAARGEDPEDPHPSLHIMRQFREETPYGENLPEDYWGNAEPVIKAMQVHSDQMSECIKILPRLAGKSWWLTKQVETFAPEEMRDLEFEPAISLLAEVLRTTNALAGLGLVQYGSLSFPVVSEASKSTNVFARRCSARVLAQIHFWDQSRFVNNRPPLSGLHECILGILPALLADPDPLTRSYAAQVAQNDWDPVFAPEMIRLLGDPYGGIQTTAQLKLGAYPRVESIVPTLKKLIFDDGPAASSAIFILDREPFTRSEALRMLSSTNLPVLRFALWQLSRTESVNELKPVLTNSLATARYLGLEELAKMRDKPAIDRIVAMTRDPNEGVRWTARRDFRLITKQMLGADPAKYEQWWAENRETFTAAPLADRRWGW